MTSSGMRFHSLEKLSSNQVQPDKKFRSDFCVPIFSPVHVIKNRTRPERLNVCWFCSIIRVWSPNEECAEAPGILSGSRHLPCKCDPLAPVFHMSLSHARRGFCSSAEILSAEIACLIVGSSCKQVCQSTTTTTFEPHQTQALKIGNGARRLAVVKLDSYMANPIQSWELHRTPWAPSGVVPEQSQRKSWALLSVMQKQANAVLYAGVHPFVSMLAQ